MHLLDKLTQESRAPTVSDSCNATLLATVRIHWRSFVPAWIFPAIFFYGGLIADHLGHSNLFFIVELPLFFLSFSRASRLWIRRDVSYWHVIFLSVITPFVILAFAVFAHLAIRTIG
jgi:hypothetical protein